MQDPQKLAVWTKWIAAAAATLEVLDIRDVIKIARLARRRWVNAQTREIALIRGDKDPDSGMVYGPIGSTTYDPKAHARIVEDKARRQHEFMYLVAEVQRKQQTIIWIVLAAAGVVFLTDTVTPGAGPGVAGMGNLDPIAVAALGLGIWALVEEGEGGREGSPVDEYLYRNRPPRLAGSGFGDPLLIR